MTPPPINRYGRKAGRGIRPWLLLPKVVAVAIYLGGLAAVLGIWLISDFTSLDLADPRRAMALRLTSRLIIFIVVPALLLAMVLGVGLLLQFPRLMLRMRWLQVKLISLAILIPSTHLVCSSRLHLIRQATDQATSDHLARQFAWGMCLALAGSLWVVVLARLKPQLGQNPAQAYASATSKSDTPDLPNP
jgi:uncharacterized membrane protein